MNTQKNYWDVSKIHQIENFFGKLKDSLDKITIWLNLENKRHIFNATITDVDSFKIKIKGINNFDLLNKIDNHQVVFFHYQKEEMLFKSTINKILIDDNELEIAMPSFLKLLEKRKYPRFNFSREKRKDLIIENDKTKTRYLLNIQDLSQNGLSFITKLDSANPICIDDIFTVDFLSGHKRPQSLQVQVVKVEKINKRLNDGSYNLNIGLKFNYELDEVHHDLVDIDLIKEQELNLLPTNQNDLLSMLSILKAKNKKSANKLIKNLNILNVELPKLETKHKYQLIQRHGIRNIVHSIRICYPEIIKSFMSNLRVDLKEEIEYLLETKQTISVVLEKQDIFIQSLLDN